MRRSLGAVLLFSLIGSAYAQLNGAAYTSTCAGAIVDKNTYTQGEDVFLNGGPQNQNGKGLNDGVYFFQVTIPSGQTLLSQDPAMDRLLLVSGGNVVGRCDASGNVIEPGGSATCPPDGAYPHPDGMFNNANGSTPVQLWPFDPTTNQGGEYKAWLIAWKLVDKHGNLDDGSTTGSHVDPNDSRSVIYVDKWTKTDNFKIRPQNQGNNTVFLILSGRKFYDTKMDDRPTENDAPSDPAGQNFTIQIDLVFPPNCLPTDSNGNPVPPPSWVVTDPNTGFWLTGSTTVLSQADGSWSLNDVPDGTSYTVSEVLPGGSHWLEVTPQPNNNNFVGYQGTLSGVNVDQLDFGNIQQGRISGKKFYDGNLSGDSSQPGVSGITIHIAVTEPDGSTASEDDVTDANGNFTTNYYPDGSTYVITEVLPNGSWLQTTGTSYNGTIGQVTGGMGSAGTQAPLPAPGSGFPPFPYDVTFNIPDATGFNFGNVLQAHISGVKFYDKNMNGTKDSGETGVSGFTIHIVATKPNSVVVTEDVVTAADGSWTSSLYPDGTTFAVSEVIPNSNWLETTPVGNLLNATLSSSGAPYSAGSTISDVTGLTFGNILQTTLSGDKFYDSNANAAFDNEPFIKGFKITVAWTKPNGATGTTVVYTDASGAFTVGPYPDGTTFKISEVLPPNPTGKIWHQSFPTGTGTYTGSISGGSGPFTAGSSITPLTGYRFGNFLTGGSGALTIGFWSNKNGYNSASALGWTAVFNILNNSNLRKANGTFATWPVSATGYKSYQSWVLSANATNMAFMLSAQLSALELDVANGGITNGTYIYAPGTLSANILGYAQVGAIIAEAKTELGLHGLTTSSGAQSAFRAYQGALQTAIMNATNGSTTTGTVQPPVTVIVPSPY